MVKYMYRNITLIFKKRPLVVKFTTISKIRRGLLVCFSDTPSLESVPCAFEYETELLFFSFSNCHMEKASCLSFGADCQM